MSKLTFVENNASAWLAANGPYCPGDQAHTVAGREVKAVLDRLVRKRCADVEMTDDGPRYSVPEQERAHG